MQSFVLHKNVRHPTEMADDSLLKALQSGSGRQRPKAITDDITEPTPRRYEWRWVRSQPELVEQLEELYNEKYVYNEVNLPYVVRDFLADMVSPPADYGGTDLLGGNPDSEYVGTMLVNQVLRDAYSDSYPEAKLFSEDRLTTIRRWATMQQRKPKRRIAEELNGKRTQEIGAIKDYIDELQRREEEAAAQAKAEASSAAAAGAHQRPTGDEPVEMVRERGNANKPAVGKLSFRAAEVPRKRRSEAQESLQDKIARLRDEQIHTSVMQKQLQREKLTQESHNTSLAASCGALFVMALIMIPFAVLGQDGYAIIITLPLAVCIGLWGYIVSHRSSRSVSLTPFTIASQIVAFGYLIYAILRSTLFFGSDPDTQFMQNAVLFFVWLIEALLIGISMYATSLTGLARRLLSRKVRARTFLMNLKV